jgi:hypothetical protein
LEWQRSDLSVAAFCGQKRLLEHRFNYWKQQFEEPPSGSESPIQNGVSFLPVAIATDAAEGTSSDHGNLRLRVRGRYLIDVPDGFRVSTLKEIIVLLEEMVCCLR